MAMAMDPARVERQLSGLNHRGNLITAPSRSKTLISFIGSSHIKRILVDDFPEIYHATQASYNAHITNFYYNEQIRYIINYKHKATAVVLMFGGNDVAFKGHHNKPSDNEIIDAFLDTISTLHRYNFLVLLTPILPRTETFEEESGVTVREYRNRRKYINNIVKREALAILGYDPRIGLEINENDLDIDGVHLKNSANQKLMEEIIVQIHDIQQKQM
ncbi:unnamed protein product, partial [Meganyctiphanes norvegica]